LPTPTPAGTSTARDSQEYNDALIFLDAWLGRMVARLKADGIYDHTAVYVTSDHGFDVGTTTTPRRATPSWPATIRR